MKRCLSSLILGGSFGPEKKLCLAHPSPAPCRHPRSACAPTRFLGYPPPLPLFSIKIGHGEVRVYRSTGVSCGVRRTTWERSLKIWELQISCFEDFLGGENVLGLVPASLPHTLGCACTFYAPTSFFWRSCRSSSVKIFFLIFEREFCGKFGGNFAGFFSDPTKIKAQNLRGKFWSIFR